MTPGEKFFQFVVNMCLFVCILLLGWSVIQQNQTIKYLVEKDIAADRAADAEAQ